MARAKLAAALWMLGAIALVFAGGLLAQARVPFFVAAFLFIAVAIMTLRKAR